MTKLCSLREDEPLVDFVLLWIIVSAFMWVMDWVNVAVVNKITTKIGLLNFWVIVDGVLILIWLCWSFVSLWKMSQKTSKKTRIMNVVEESHPKAEPNNRWQVTHLFDDLGEE